MKHRCMTYREFKPDILLCPYIETYWTISGFTEKEEFHKILPDGCIDIIFSTNDNIQFGLTPYLPNIVGTMTTYLSGSYLNNVNIVGIRFKPVGITAFLRTSIYEFTDLRIDLNLAEMLFDESFYTELSNKTTTQVKILHFDSYLISKLAHINRVDTPIINAVNLIQGTKGTLSLTEIANKSCLSLRQFERRFKNAIGVSPKMFSKIAKFKHTVSYLENNSNTSLFLAAVDCGYYDQSHLIKDFKALSGDYPSNFRL